MSNIELFTQGYCEALTRSLDHPRHDHTVDDLRDYLRSQMAIADVDASMEDLEPSLAHIPYVLTDFKQSRDFRERVAHDCRLFALMVEPHLSRAYAGTSDYCPKLAGDDFWCSRNREGTGFWLRKELNLRSDPAISSSPTVGHVLETVARLFGPVEIYLSLDAQIHVE